MQDVCFPSFVLLNIPADCSYTSSAVVAYENTDVTSGPYVFRTYQLHEPRGINPVERGIIINPGDADTHQICEVARATSAAPGYFDPIILDGKEYSDGGLGNNNPIKIATNEVMQKTGTEKVNAAFRVVLSLGTGEKPTTVLRVQHKFPRISGLKPVKKISKIVKALKHHAVDVEKDHKAFQGMVKEANFKHYYRWSGGDLGGLKLDEWRTIPKKEKPVTEEFIRTSVQAYMESPHIKEEVVELAKQLVETRRLRITQNEDKIRRFTWSTLYRCPVCVDDDPELYQETQAALKEHIIAQHTHIPHADIDHTIKYTVPQRPSPGAPF